MLCRRPRIDTTCGTPPSSTTTVLVDSLGVRDLVQVGDDGDRLGVGEARAFRVIHPDSMAPSSSRRRRAIHGPRVRRDPWMAWAVRSVASRVPRQPVGPVAVHPVGNWALNSSSPCRPNSETYGSLPHPTNTPPPGSGCPSPCDGACWLSGWSYDFTSVAVALTESSLTVTTRLRAARRPRRRRCWPRRRTRCRRTCSGRPPSGSGSCCQAKIRPSCSAPGRARP